jgi:aminopeptidase-like protein
VTGDRPPGPDGSSAPGAPDTSGAPDVPGSTEGAGAAAGSGPAMLEMAAELFPLDRSLTGDGVRETLRRIGETVPLAIHEVPSGTPVLDWTVPREWNVREAWVAGPDGRRVVDFRDSNLHLVGYSVPVRTRLPLAALREHLHTLPDRPDLVPYRTSYWHETWGFCLRHRDLEALPDGEYEVVIDATLEDGALSYGELFLEGEVEDEVLVSCHVCHPSMANDNLSGVVVGAHLGRILSRLPRRLSYRILFLPGTVGPIVWLARNREGTARIRHGLVLACLGDDAPLTWKRSRRGDAPVDRAAAHVLEHSSPRGRVRDFSPLGYDERQYGSPGFDLPVGRLTRSPHGEFREYHTSGDDLSILRPERLEGSLAAILEIFRILERDRVLLSRFPYGEPQLGRRGLYRTLGGEAATGASEEAMLWALNLADGEHSLLGMAERSGLPFRILDRTAEILEREGLLEAPGRRPPAG